MKEFGSTYKLLQNFKNLLKTNKVIVKDGYTCLQMECKVCNKFNSKPPPMAFVNKTTGTFLCPTCELNAPLNIVEQFYGEDKKHSAVPEYFFGKPYKSKFIPTFASTTNTGKFNNILDNSIFSTLDVNVLQNLGIDFDIENKILHVPLRNYSGRIVGEKILNMNTKLEETVPKSSCSGLVMHSWSIKTQKAILVLNLIDLLSLTMAKINDYTIICLPYQLKSLPLECLPLLESFKELTIWFDIDTIGWDIARNFANKLNEKRCLYIRPTESQTTPYNAFIKNLNIENILKSAQPLNHKHITTFAFIKDDLFCELQNIEKVNGVKWKKYPALNKLLKGHRKGELTILTGPTGSGKTTFMSDYSLDLAQQGVSTLWGSFEIRNTRLASTLLRQFVGYSLSDKLNEFEYWAEKFEKIPIYFLTFHGQQNIKLVMDTIEHAQYIHDIQHIIIDNIQFMMGISSSAKIDKFWEQDAIINAFRRFATAKNVHVTLVMHPRKERDTEDLTTSSIFGSAKATQEADNILIIQDKRLTSVRGKKFLQVAKNRYTGDLGVIPLVFDKNSLSFALKNVPKEPKDVTASS